MASAGGACCPVPGVDYFLESLLEILLLYSFLVKFCFPWVVMCELLMVGEMSNLIDKILTTDFTCQEVF